MRTRFHATLLKTRPIDVPFETFRCHWLTFVCRFFFIMSKRTIDALSNVALALIYLPPRNTRTKFARITPNEWPSADALRLHYRSNPLTGVVVSEYRRGTYMQIERHGTRVG